MSQGKGKTDVMTRQSLVTSLPGERSGVKDMEGKYISLS